VGLLVPSLARAQASGGNENISAAVANPERYLYENGVCPTCAATDVTDSPRPQNLNPSGVNFTDCEQNLRLDFPLVLSGFAAGDSASVQAWAGTVDCTQNGNRISTAGVEHPCWQVAGFYGPVVAMAGQSITMSVYARDVLRYEAPPSGTGVTQVYEPTFNSSSQGASACHVQPTDAAVPLNIYFIAIDSTANTVGTSYEYSLSTDLVAPAPPCNVDAQGGSNLLDVQWTAPDSDPDRVGYAVWTAHAGEAGCTFPPQGGFTLTPSGAPCTQQGISEYSLALLAGMVDDPTATSLTETSVSGGESVATVVTSVDGSGNFGPPSSSACASITGAASVDGGAPAPAETATAKCGCSEAGATAPASGALALGAVALMFARRRRR